MPPNNMYLEENTTSSNNEKKSSYKVPKLVAHFGALLLIAIFIGSILVTYYSKPDPVNLTCNTTMTIIEKEVTPKIDCPNILEWAKTCPVDKSVDKNITEKNSTQIVKINYRLPRSLKPYFYEIIIKPYFTVNTEPSYYQGHVLIKFKCLKNTSRLVLHKTEEIEIDNLTFELNSITPDESFIPVKELRNSNYLITNWTYDKETQFLIIDFYKEIFVQNNEYSLGIGFKNMLKNDNAGFYKSFYKSSNGDKRWLIASQMEPTDARKSFICFDEPDMKAKFKIRIVHDSSLTAISNMPVQRSIDLDLQDPVYKWKQTDFYETVEMSTYLVALVISDFKCLNTSSMKKVNINVCSRPNAVSQLGHALNASGKILDFFESYYKIEYPLPKLDHVALPDFSAGAMENWGLITYREARLLYDPSKSSQSVEQDIIEVIAHEIAHQWFGNLVSPSWWTDLWLNEGFARYMQFVGTDNYRPEWDMFDQFLSVFFSILHLDSVQSSHPISVDVNNPDEINEIFDGITYGKGGSVIRMMNYFLGESIFKNGLTEYLNKYKYGNAIQDNLWDSLEQRARFEGKRLNLKNIMNTWTKQMGHPLINVKILNKTHISISQEHFLFDSSLLIQKSPYNYKWYVPFTYSVENLDSHETTASLYNISNIHHKTIWLEPNQEQKIIKLDFELNDDSYLLANLDVSGFYRVNYDEKNWMKIKEQLLKNNHIIPAKIRSQLINDIFSLSQANKIDPSEPLELVKYLKNEMNYLPWYTFISRLSFYLDMIESTEIYGEFQEFLFDLIRPIYQKLTWTDQDTDSWLFKKLRANLIRFACSLGLPECVDKSKILYNEWIRDDSINNIPKNLRSIVYCTSIKYGSFNEWSFASFKYDQEQDSNAKRELQLGMSCSKEQWLQIKHLNNQLNETKTRRQDALFGLRYSAMNPYSIKLTWNYLKQNWDVLLEKYGGMSFGAFISDFSRKFNTQNDYNEFVNFFKNVSHRSASREIKISSERIKANIHWINKNYNQLEKWLKNQTSNEKLENIDYRLPDNLKPHLYDLMLKVNIKTPDVIAHEQFSFHGWLNITFTCERPTDEIVLHSKNLLIQKFNVYKLINQVLYSVEIEKNLKFDLLREFLIIKLKQQCIQNSNYTLELSYHGNLTDTLAGFYLSSYVDTNANMNYLALTHFEPTDARRAFPCFDEPSLKSQFKISIQRHKNFSSVSNMPLVNTVKLDNDWELDNFERSVSMSTYLVAFAVTNFKRIRKNSTIHKIEVEVMARADAIEKGYGEYGLDEASRIIDYFSDYFDIKYPLKKSTQIAIPDFNAGAMENWGLITYREKYILYNPNYDSLISKRFISVVVAHELAHQWFGNLVSPEWWNDLWLNEGFASWVEYLGCNHTHPEWKDLDYFFVEKISVMQKDSLQSSHAINTQVNDPSEINSLFDEISYDKGASLVRMMNSFLSIRTFKKGISNYLKRFQMRNANQDNVWEELTKQGHIDRTLDYDLTVKQIMDTWTLKKGYPVVTIERQRNRYNTAVEELRLSQKWFLLNPSRNFQSTDLYKNTKWYVPFTYTTKSKLSFDFESRPFWLKPTENETRLNVESLQLNDWIIGNLKHSGFYRVNYDLDNWLLLINQLNTNYELIDVTSRAALIDDSFNLAHAELINYDIYLNLIKYLKNEIHSIPFEAASEGLAFINDMLLDSDYNIYSLFKQFYKSLYINSYKTYGWSNLTDLTKLYLQLDSIKVMCKLGNTDCIDKSKYYFQRWIQFNESIPNNFRKIVLETVVHNGNENEWFYLFDKAKSANSYSERVTILKALTNTKDYNLLKLILKKSSDKTLIKSQDEIGLIGYISNNQIGKSLVWDYLIDNWDLLIEKYSNAFNMNDLLTTIMSKYNNRGDLRKLDNFLNTKPNNLDKLENVFKEIKENILANIQWMDKNLDTIHQWLLNL